MRLRDVALIDMKLPDGNGIDLLRELKRCGKMSVAVVVTAYPTEKNSVKAF